MATRSGGGLSTAGTAALSEARHALEKELKIIPVASRVNEAGYSLMLSVRSEEELALVNKVLKNGTYRKFSVEIRDLTPKPTE